MASYNSYYRSTTSYGNGSNNNPPGYESTPVFSSFNFSNRYLNGTNSTPSKAPYSQYNRQLTNMTDHSLYSPQKGNWAVENTPSTAGSGPHNTSMNLDGFTSGKRYSRTNSRGSSPRGGADPKVESFDCLRDAGFDIDNIEKERKVNGDLTKVTKGLLDMSRNIKNVIDTLKIEGSESKNSIRGLEDRLQVNQERVDDSKKRLEHSLSLARDAGAKQSTPKKDVELKKSGF